MKGGDSRGKNFLWNCANACSILARREDVKKRNGENRKNKKIKKKTKNMVLGTQSVESVDWMAGPSITRKYPRC